MLNMSATATTTSARDRRAAWCITNGEGGASHEVDGSGACEWLGGCPAPAFTAFRAFRHGALRLRFTAGTIEGAELCGPAAGDDDVSCTVGTALDSFVITGTGSAIVDAIRPATTTSLRVR